MPGVQTPYHSSTFMGGMGAQENGEGAAPGACPPRDEAMVLLVVAMSHLASAAPRSAGGERSHPQLCCVATWPFSRSCSLVFLW